MIITVHLLRHGEVYNPSKVIYERLPGFHLSEKGKLMAQMVADHISKDSQLSKISKIISSPLQRTLETSNPVRLALPNAEFTTDERLIEVSNKILGQNLRTYCLENIRKGHILRVLKLIYNPLLPSWGEHSKDVAKRMLESIREHAFAMSEVVADNVSACENNADSTNATKNNKHILFVSHQRPIWALKRLITDKTLLALPRYRKDVRLCSLSSLTFEVFNDNQKLKLINNEYLEIAKELY